ncbi:MAG: tail fiber protein, partial [Ignavibacteria bacterium]
MKKKNYQLPLAILFLLFSNLTFSQWETDSINNIFYNTGNVGIGTMNPQHNLQIGNGSSLSLGLKGGIAGADARIIFEANDGSDRFQIVSDMDGSTNNDLLRFQEQGNDVLVINGTGSVGIGTMNPQHNLQIGNGSSLSLGLKGGIAGADAQIIFEAGDGSDRFQIVSDMDGSTDNDLLRFQEQGNDVLVINGTGNVGIGTTSPDETLTVKGKIHAEEIIVDLNVPHPDYVFEEDYELKSIRELEQYVKTNKHLPGIPTSEEVKENGLSLGEMQTKL